MLPVYKLHAELHAILVKPEFAEIDIGEAAATLLSLAMFVASCSPRSDEISRLDTIWSTLINSSRN